MNQQDHRTTIVTTTIYTPELLSEYCQNLKAYNHENVDFIVIGDKKTPADVDRFCRSLTDKHGVDIAYSNVEQQLSYLDRFPELLVHIPFNSIQRRNIGLLMAYEARADVIITIDDDNLVTEEDFVGAHSVVGSSFTGTSLQVESGWFNVCDLLVEEKQRPFYHRGYPMGERWIESEPKRTTRTGRAVVNAGLWLEDPDIDALTRMDMPIRAIDITEEGRRGITLEIGTWSPFNSQNTALARDVIPAYFLSPYVGRYDDIWASYFLRKIIDHMGDCVCYGPPLVKQERNVHNLWRDLENERIGMEMSDRLIELLRGMSLTKTSYADCFAELTRKLGESIQTSEVLNPDEQRTLVPLVEGMGIWSRVFSGLTAERDSS